MFTIISVSFLFLKMLGIITISWKIVLLSEILFLLFSYLEIRMIYKWIDKRFK
nr:MAG TPA: hypothetical protein [Caudoviricetes sp.]